MKEENCDHHYVKGETTWRRNGLWKYLIMILYCENCGDIIEHELDSK